MNLKDIRKKRERIIFEDGSQEKISLEKIIEFEEKYNIKIPEQYKNFVLEYNGINVEVGQFFDPDDDNNIISLDQFSSLEYPDVGTSEDGFSEDGCEVLPPKGFLIIGDTVSGHSEFLIGVEPNENYGKIFYCNDREENSNYLLANNFEEFFNNSIPKYENEYHQYCMEGEIDKAIKLINEGFRCDFMIYFALSGAYDNDTKEKKKEYLKLIEILINKGEDILGMLSYSALINAPEIVKLICQKGGNINELNFASNTALYEAFNHKDPDLIDYLIKSGADIKIKNNSKENILTKIFNLKHYGSEKDKKFIEIVEQIIKKEYKIKNLSEL